MEIAIKGDSWWTVTIGDEVLGGDVVLCYHPLPTSVSPFTVSDRVCKILVTASDFLWTLLNCWSCCPIANG